MWRWAPATFLPFAGVAVWAAQAVPGPLHAALSAADIVLCGVGISRAISQGLRPVSLLFYIFDFSWLGFAPAFQLANHEAAWNDGVVLGETSNITGALLMNLALTAVFLLLENGARVASAWHRGTGIRQLRSAATVRGQALFTYAFALVVLAPYAIQANGGLSNLFSSRHQRAYSLTASGLTVQQAGGVTFALVGLLPGALAVALTALSIIRHRQGGTSLSAYAYMTIGGTGVILFDNPFAYTRFISATAFLSLVLYVTFPRSRRAGVVLGLAAVFGTLLVYPLANQFRYGGQTMAAEGRYTGMQAFRGPDFDGFQQIVNTFNYVSATGFHLGHYLLSSLLFFIPRTAWAGKSVPAAIDVSGHAGYVFTNLSLPIHAEFYLEFGWPGVVMCALLLGAIAARLDTAWRGQDGSRWMYVAPYMALAIIGIVRGPSGSQTPVWLPVVLLLAIGLKAPSRRTAPVDSTSRPAVAAAPRGPRASVLGSP